MDIRTEKLQAALQDKKYAEELLALETVEQIQAKLEEKGIEMTREEVQALVDEVVARMNTNDGELSEDDLGAVSGGLHPAIVGMAIIIGCIAVGVYVGWKAAGGCKKR